MVAYIDGVDFSLVDSFHRCAATSTARPGKLMLPMLVVAEMERDRLIERTHVGLQRAIAKSRTCGRPRKTTQEQRAAMIDARERGSSISALGRLYTVSRSTVMALVSPKSKTV
jgi:putative DNA-invertase from lambdoid prophage Rac